MGKIRIKTLGVAEIEEKQKKESKERRSRKKSKIIKEAKVEPKASDEKEKIITKTKTKTKGKKKGKKIVKQPRGKNYLQAKKKIGKEKALPLNKAIKLLRKIAYANFDESVELHINTNTTGLKGEAALPHGTGKKLRVVVVDDNVLAKIEGGSIDFDVLIAHPSYMKKLVKYARILGPKGLMPNSKNGTVSIEPEKTAKKFMEGSLHWKTESKFPLIHQLIGKLSFKDKELEENIKTFLGAMKTNEIKDVYLKATMSPAIKIIFPLE